MLYEFDIREVLSLLNVRLYKARNSTEDIYFCPQCDKDSRHGHLYVNKYKNVAYCVVCSMSGNPVTITSRILNIDTKEAYKYLVENIVGEKKNVYKPTTNTKKTTEQENNLYDTKTLNEVYNIILDRLTLDKQDKINLLNRGLSEQKIKENKYRTTPSKEKANEIIKELINRGYDLKKVAGFYLDEDNNYKMLSVQGYFIPCKNEKGEITCLLIRTRMKSPKYLTFSASTKGGAKVLLQPHITQDIKKNDEIYITEGILKSDVACYLSGYTFIGIHGVSNNHEQIKEIIKRNNIKKTYICFDMDMAENKAVSDNCKKLYETIKDVAETKILKWDKRYKGIDDYLLALKQQKQKAREL